MKLKETILALVKDQIKVQVVTGKVLSVDETKMICDIDLQNAPDLLDVRLRSIIDEQDKGILILPKVGSYVLVGLINNRVESSFVCGYSEVDKIRLIIDEIELSGDAFGGIVKVQELTDKLNNMESAFNSFVGEFNTHTHNAPQAPSGAIPTLPPLILSTQNVTPTQVSDLENEKVKHG